MDKATDQAIRSAFGTLKVRPNDEAFSSTEVVTRLKGYGVDVTTNEGMLELTQNGAVVSVPTVLRAFASKPENVALFVSEGDDHHLWDSQKKQEYIAANGLQAWERKIGQKTLRANVDVANMDISKAEYLSMTNSEKSRWISTHGLAAQAQVLSKKK